MNNSPLEFLARQYDNVVKYDAQGNPSIFVKFPKMKSKDLDSSLPDHTHPAFIVNGVEQDYILLGKYKAASLTGSGSDGGTLYSLPNMPPAHTRSADQFLAQLRAFGGGVSGMTVAGTRAATATTAIATRTRRGMNWAKPSPSARSAASVAGCTSA